MKQAGWIDAHGTGWLFTIGKTNYPLRSGAGAKDFKGALNYSVGPGTYTIIVKIPGQPPKTERVTITAGSTWGIVALPTGGYIALQLDGAWLRAPYLHNGSVPTLRALLEPALILGLGLLIAFIIVSILLAILGLNELVA